MFRNTHASVGQNAGRVELRIADCGLRINPFPIRNPKSEIRNRNAHRGGITLTEVLIAMGILTIGLLGVAALFPVGSYYMQKGDVADRGSAIAQAAFADALARGLLNPSTWYAMVPTPAATSAAEWSKPNFLYGSVDGQEAPNVTHGTFTRPFAAAYAIALNNPNVSASIAAKQFGGGYVIDPLGVNAFAAANTGPGTPNRNIIASAFPSSAYRWFNPNGSPPTPGYPWSPWSGAGSGTFIFPLRRVTLRQSTTGWQLSPAVADRMFRTNDDLSLELPTAQDKPSFQRWELADLDNDGKADDPLARQSRGDYSWIITVLPTTAAAQAALARNPSGHAYEVSVIVFYKRVLPSALPTGSTDVPLVAAQERMAKARIISAGLSGGEVLLERFIDRDTPSSVPESPFQELKTGQWIVLCGPHPSSTDAQPMFVARWYRVLAIEGKERRLNSQGTYDPAPPSTDPDRRLVALRGPEWPWEPSTDPGNVSNNLCVGIIPGAVAVHSKTIRLEGNSVWGGGAGGADGLVFGAGTAPPPTGIGFPK